MAEMKLEGISRGSSFNSNQEDMQESSLGMSVERLRHLIDYMDSKRQEVSPISHRSVEENQRCIFKVPPRTTVLYPKYYYPKIVSIGPYHRGEDYVYEDEEYRYKEYLRDGEKTKWLFLNSLLSRTHTGDAGLAICIFHIAQMEEKIRSSYNEDIRLTSDQLVESMVLDGCFIIECLLRVTGSVDSDRNDSILQDQRKLGILMSDMIKFENQIPFFVLEDLLNALKVEYNCSSGNPEFRIQSLPQLLLVFFNKALGIPEYAKIGSHYLGGSNSHILHILRSSIVPTNAVEPQVDSKLRKMVIKVLQFFQSRQVLSGTTHSKHYFSEKQYQGYPVARNIHCASILRKKGIKIRGGAFLGLSDVKFSEGELWIPRFVFDNFTCSAILNCIAYEQCNMEMDYKPMYITGFAAVLDSLVNSAEDVRALRDSNVIEHFYRTDEEVAQFCNNLGKAFPLGARIDDVWELFADINSYCKDPRKLYWASVNRTYFREPWIFFPALAVAILLLLTMTQAFFSAISYFRPPR